MLQLRKLNNFNATVDFEDFKILTSLPAFIPIIMVISRIQHSVILISLMYVHQFLYRNTSNPHIFQIQNIQNQKKINPYKHMRKSQERNLGDISALVWFYILPFPCYLRMAIITHCKSREAYSWSISTFICPSDSDRNVRNGETAEG